MKKIYDRAEEAVYRSISHDEISRCWNDEENIDHLMGVADDWCESFGNPKEGMDFWGTTEDGDEWRVETIPLPDYK